MEDAARAALPPPVAPLPAATPDEGGEEAGEAAEAAPEAPEPPKIEISDADLLQVHPFLLLPPTFHSFFPLRGTLHVEACPPTGA